MMIDPKIKKLLGYKPDEPDKNVIADWKKRASRVCKPCWEIKYCPYGPWVEHSPLLPPTLSEALKHQEYLKKCLKSKKLGDGRPISKFRYGMFQKMINEFNPNEYPKEIPKEIEEMGCSIFGHICPVVFTNEGFTETMKPRRRGRYIPFHIRLKVARRDDYTCQICKKHLMDDEIEFDHIIPISKGGSTEESNLRLTCFKCNQEKTNKVKL